MRPWQPLAWMTGVNGSRSCRKIRQLHWSNRAAALFRTRRWALHAELAMRRKAKRRPDMDRLIGCNAKQARRRGHRPEVVTIWDNLRFLGSCIPSSASCVVPEAQRQNAPNRLTPGRDVHGVKAMRQRDSRAWKGVLVHGRFETAAVRTVVHASHAAMARMETRSLPALLLLGPSYKKPLGSKQA